MFVVYICENCDKCHISLWIYHRIINGLNKMTTTEQMLQEAKDKINAMSKFELQKMFRDAGFKANFILHQKPKEPASFRKKRRCLKERYSTLFLTDKNSK